MPWSSSVILPVLSFIYLNKRQRNVQYYCRGEIHARIHHMLQYCPSIRIANYWDPACPRYVKAVDTFTSKGHTDLKRTAIVPRRVAREEANNPNM